MSGTDTSRQLDAKVEAGRFAWPSLERDTDGHPLVSIVAPMYNEEGGALKLIEEIDAAMQGVAHEIIMVDDCSSDQTLSILRRAQADFPALRVVRHVKNAGQSRAVRTGVLAAQAPIVATLDGDGQNDPADLPKLVEALQQAGPNVQMIGGERQKRQDTAAKRHASRIANKVRKALLDDGAADTGCGIKAFYREAFLRLPYFDHVHRYIPALMRREGFEVEFLPVAHRARAHGASKYTNLGRLAVAFRDILGVLWLRSRSRSPGSIEEFDQL